MSEYDLEKRLSLAHGLDVYFSIVSKLAPHFCGRDDGQLEGVDMETRIDMKYDAYDNENIVIELENPQWAGSGHTESWLDHGKDSDWIVFVKMAKNVAYCFTKGELRAFTKTPKFAHRISIKAKSSPTVFKNFKYSEICEALGIDRLGYRLKKIDWEITPKKQVSDFIWQDEAQPGAQLGRSGLFQ